MKVQRTKKGSALKPAPLPPLMAVLYVNDKGAVLKKNRHLCAGLQSRGNGITPILVTRNEPCRQDDTRTQSLAQEHTRSGAVIPEDQSAVRMIKISTPMF